MATTARKAPARSTKVPATVAPRARAEVAPPAPEPPAEKPVGAATHPKTKVAKVGKVKRIRGSFSMPEADHARIAKLKASARRNGLKVKKNELLRLGLRALQTLTGPELHDAVLSLRVEPAPRKAK